MEDGGLRSGAVVGGSLGGRIALEVALEQPRLVRRLVLVNALGLGRPKVTAAQMTYGLVTLPRVGEAAMRFARDALHWAPPNIIRPVAPPPPRPPPPPPNSLHHPSPHNTP